VSEDPVLRVVRGPATEEEVAALVAVLLARPAPGAPAPAPASGWADRAATLRGRVPWTPGPDAWRTAGRPS
jgi:hypothetical protein